MSRHHRPISSRGLTRFEVTAIVGLLGVTAAAIGLFTSSASAGTDRKSAETDARRIVSAADDWRERNSQIGCPTVSRLIEDGNLESSARTDDPWGGRYRIDCSGSQTSVRSPGRDGRLRTDDDVVATRDG